MGDRRIDGSFRRYCRHGDVKALGRAFDLVAPELLTVARHLCRDEAEAEDAVQASFLTVLERARDFDRERRLMPWMVGILANHARAMVREGARRPDPERMRPRPADDPVARAGERELAAAVERTIEALPRTLRETVRMHLLHGMGPGELARALEIAPGNARVRLHRGLDKLRKALPTGFAAGATLAQSPGRGLAAVRAEVLARADWIGSGLVSPAAALTPPSLLGGILVTHRVALACIALVVLLAGGLWLRGELAEPAPPPDAPLPITLAEPEQAHVPPEPAPSAAEVEARRVPLEPPAATQFSGTVVDLHMPTRFLAGARVWTLPEGASERVLRATADGRGRFSFEAPPAEEDTLFIEAPGFAPFRAPVSERAKGHYRRSHPRQVWGSGARVDIGIVELVRGVEIDGRVLHEDGRGAVGAELHLVWSGLSWGPFLPMAEGPIGRTTAGGLIDPDGRVPIQALVRADEATYLLVAVLGDRMGWTRFAALEGRDRVNGLEVVLRAGFPLRVRVVGEGGEPVAGARVACDRNGPDLGTDFRSRRSPNTWPRHVVPEGIERFFVRWTDSDGEAHFPSLPSLELDGSSSDRPVQFEVSVQADGFADGSRGRKLEGDPQASIEIALRARRQLVVTGRAVDVGGRPIEGAQAKLRSIGTRAATTPDGCFELRPPIDTPLEELGSVVVSAEGRVAWGVRLPRPLAEDRHVELGDVMLSRPTSISGRVVDERGQPVAGAAVTIGGGGELGWPVDVPLQHSGPDGRFVHGHAPEGEWPLQVIYVQGSSDFACPSQPVWAEGGAEDVVLVVERGPEHPGRVIAQIVDRTSGAALDALAAGVHRADSRSGGIRQEVKVSLLAGRVEVGNVAPGRYQLWVQVPGRPLTFGAFEIGETQGEVPMRIEVDRAGRILGRLHPIEGVEPSRVQVRAWCRTPTGFVAPRVHPQAGPQGVWRPDERGRILLEDLCPGSWWITVCHEDRIAGPVEVSVHPGEESAVDLPLEAGGIIEVDLGSLPDSGYLEVSAQTDDGPRATTGYLLVEGWQPRIEVTVPPGRTAYEVSLSATGEGPPILSGEVELERGQRVVLGRDRR